jgi:Ca2+/H+ antiporter
LQEDDEDCENASEEAVIGFWSGFAWLVIMTVFIAILSEYVVDTIQVTAFYFVKKLLSSYITDVAITVIVIWLPRCKKS